MILVTCSVEKNTGTTRFYHSLTSRFNIYFNGYESYKAGLTRISNGHRDDYAEMLNVFEYSDPETATMASSDMETAIQKASTLIALKSLTARPETDSRRDISEKERKLLDRKEFNEWVDDSYLLIGKARFHKHEFSEAESVFTYCINEANDPLIAKEAMIWLARLKNETGDYSEATRILREFDFDAGMPAMLRSMYHTTLADLFIRQKRYSDATDPLMKAIENIKGKKNKYRLTYLLAQLYEQEGNGVMATHYFRKVAGMNPPYEVEFNARINIAGVFDVNSGNPEELVKELNKMLRDSKNKEFHDQIYYALGNLAMKESNEAEAIGYYKKSASAVTGNPNQKGRSYLSLSDHYYKKSDYIQAGIFLDSAVFFLDQSNPQYDQLRLRSRNLNELVSHLIIIEKEDSLQRVALMPLPERNQLIGQIISELTRAEQEGESTDYNDRYNIGQYYENERRFQGNIEQEGKWYFYNQSSLTFGRTEFRRRWGDRRLEDNWRRANRARITTLQSPSDDIIKKEPLAADTSVVITDNKRPEYYLRDLPLTDSLLEISNERIADALLNAAKAYAENIHDTLKSIETYEILIGRFPESPGIPEALYDLYRMNEDGNKIRSETYRQRLIEKYPESEFARILSDPDYYKNMLASIKATEILYQEAYALYAEEKFDEAVLQIDYALEKYPENELSAKFRLLQALCSAHSQDQKIFRNGLKAVIESYPGSQESVRARELLAHFDEQVPVLKIEEEKVVAQTIYVADTTTARTFVLIIPDPAFNLNQATFDVISYNIDYYTNRNFKTEGNLTDRKYLMITVSGFRNFTEAMEYRRKFESARPVRNPAAVKMLTFIIGGDNLNKFREDRNPERYDIFFRENFMKMISQTGEANNF